MSCGSSEGHARTFVDNIEEGELSNLIVLCDPCDSERKTYTAVDPAFLGLIVSKTRRERVALGRALSPRNSGRVLQYLRTRSP